METNNKPLNKEIKAGDTIRGGFFIPFEAPVSGNIGIYNIIDGTKDKTLNNGQILRTVILISLDGDSTMRRVVDNVLTGEVDKVLEVKNLGKYGIKYEDVNIEEKFKNMFAYLSPVKN